VIQVLLLQLLLKIPQTVIALIQQGEELGAADDIVFGRTNSKQEEGAIRLLSGGIVDRRQLYERL
jgi:non-canonical (house-cleaning) NTP pyrophosphatase